MQNVKFLHPIFLGKDPDKGKRNAFRPPGPKAFLPYALIIFPFAAMPQKSFKDPAPSLCIPARLPGRRLSGRGLFPDRKTSPTQVP